MLSGELARRAGVSPDTLRHYERLGLLPAPERTAGNYRNYPPHTMERVTFIRNGLAMGISLADLGRVLEVRDRGGLPCREVRRLAGETLHRVERQIEEMARYQEELRRILQEWDERLRRKRGSRARLLQGLERPPHRPSFHGCKRGFRL
ncbi:MAG: heavy metal-responsive transcriptional regulator [Candidatus Polarisedimenticolia bacterium]